MLTSIQKIIAFTTFGPGILLNPIRAGIQVLQLLTIRFCSHNFRYA